MARYTGPVCRLCRRQGMKLFLKGERCFTPKCAVERRPSPPGDHSQRRRKVSEYGEHLKEKQKVRAIYGVLERQFRRYYEMANRQGGVTGENLLRLLEQRLDNVVWRAGFAATRPQARQLVNHGHFLVNGKKVDIPSYQLKSGDVVSVKEGSRELITIQHAVDTIGHPVPDWLSVTAGDRQLTMLSIPSRDQIDTAIREQMIVELYSK